MKLGAVTKLDKRNRTTLKKLTMMSFGQIMTSSSFFRFVFDLEQSRTRIADAWSATLTFSLIIILFHLTKTENKTIKFLTQFSTIALSKGTIFGKKS